MALQFEFFEDDGNAVSAGVFIPQSDLIGVMAGELADSASESLKENKVVYSIANILSNGSLTDALGLTGTAGAITGQSAVLSAKAYSFTVQYYADHESDIVDVIPLPTIGNQVGVGDVAFNDIFPNAVKVAAAGATVGEGVLIPSSLLEVFGSPNHAVLNLANDCRAYIGALIRHIVSAIPVRSASIASAITAKTILATTGLSLSTEATDAINPTTGIDINDVDKLDVFSRTFNLTIQRVENEMTQSYDVNVVTA